MDIKLLVTDLDDTLISDTTGLSENAIKAISKAKEKGIKATIATGRMHSSAFPYAKALDIAGPIISFNGALIKGMISDNIILHFPVDYDYAIEVLKFAEETDRYIQYYSMTDYYVPEHSAHSDLYGQRTNTRAKLTHKPLINSLDFAPTKILMIGNNKDDAEKLCNMAAQKFKGKLNIVRSSDTYIEFNNIKASKTAACEALAKHYGYDLRNIMAIGNGGNDVEMLRNCGLGIAVGNSVPEALEAADYICPSQEDDGVADAIQRFLLNR